MSCQSFAVSPGSSDLLELSPNLWCNNTKEKLFLGICFCDFDFTIIFTKNACFLCDLCGNVTAFYSLSLRKTTQNPLWKRQVCIEFMSVIMENNLLHKSGANSTLYNAVMKGLPLVSHIFIWNSPVFFLWKIPICNLNIFICFHQWVWYKIRNMWCHVTSCTWV